VSEACCVALPYERGYELGGNHGEQEHGIGRALKLPLSLRISLTEQEGNHRQRRSEA